jgi:hypothetical protein
VLLQRLCRFLKISLSKSRLLENRENREIRLNRSRRTGVGRFGGAQDGCDDGLCNGATKWKWNWKSTWHNNDRLLISIMLINSFTGVIQQLSEG